MGSEYGLIRWNLWFIWSNWKIYSEDTHDLPHFIDKTGSVKNSLINQGSIIKGHVENSIIFNDVIIEEGATVVDCVILNKVTIKRRIRL